ncbi:hypothetical protein M413DRAFT_27735 [Hebeloma cylindrosporum]|uniref:Autophagy-related protein 13 n=1 Tax=Hebeloma cylindrosporum TaxID=76867 RepID=A0A0C3CAZ0_HEBCY|nr:hypothetical protein M413DRAFT_27735 [Hebeloma cylindrosporum h7]
MPISNPFSDAPDRIAHDFYTKLWRLVYEFRATEALSTPHNPDSLYWYEHETAADEFCGNTLPDSSYPSRFLPNLQKYRHISKNRAIGREPMIVEVILLLPQPSKALTSSRMPEPIILETWKLSLADGQSNLTGSILHQRSRMYDECQRFCLAIHVCINELPTAEFIRQIHDSPANSAMGLKIALRLGSGSGNSIEEQFVAYGWARPPIRTYTFPPISHVYGNFILSTTCIMDSNRLLADLSLWKYYPGQLGIALFRDYFQIRGKAGFFPGVSGDRLQKEMENPRATLASEKFLPPGISKLLHIWDPMMSDSSYGWGKLAERLIQLRSSEGYILPPSVDKFNDPLRLLDADDHDPDNEFLPPDDQSPSYSSRFGIPIPRKKIRFLDDHEDAQRLLKYIIHQKVRSRRRVINSASTAGSRPSPMISGASDPITPEYCTKSINSPPHAICQQFGAKKAYSEDFLEFLA